MSFILYALPGNDALTETLARRLKADIGQLEVRRFPDGETYVRALTSPKGRRVILVATLLHPDETILPLVFAADAMRDHKSLDVGLVAPYLAYMRQDKRFLEGESVTSASFARLVSSCVDWMVTVDPHLHRRKSLSEIYTVPTMTVHAAPIIGRWLAQNTQNIMLIGPDVESRQWVKSVAEVAQVPFVILEKTRRGDHDVEISVPQTENWLDRTPVLVDDIISTARTMIETVNHLHNAGLKPPVCIGVHAIFSGNAYADLLATNVDRIITCNSIPHTSNTIDLTGVIADVIYQLPETDRAIIP